ncbi:unnamed protein product [Leuciscus chuanchicus]
MNMVKFPLVLLFVISSLPRVVNLGAAPRGRGWRKSDRSGTRLIKQRSALQLSSPAACSLLSGDTPENVREEKKHFFISLDRGPCPLEQWTRTRTGLTLDIMTEHNVVSVKAFAHQRLTFTLSVY